MNQFFPPLCYRQHRVWSDTFVLDDILLQPQVWYEGRQPGFSFLRHRRLVVGLEPCCSSIAHRIGLIKTIVFTHVPASIALALIPLPSNLVIAMALLIFRSTTNSMD